MEQKGGIFDHIIDVRDELAIRLLDDSFLKFSTKKIKFEFEIVTSNFEQAVLNSFENIAFLGNMCFCIFFKHFHV